MAECPICREEVMEGAKKCRHCFSNIDPGAPGRDASKIIELTIDHNLVKVFYIGSFVLLIFFAVAITFYGINLEDLRGNLENLRGSLEDEILSAEKIQKDFGISADNLQKEFKDRADKLEEDFRDRADKLQKDFRDRSNLIDKAATEAEVKLSELDGRLIKLDDKLIKLSEDVPDDPEYRGTSTLSDMISQIESIQKGIESNRNKIQEIKKDALIAPDDPKRELIYFSSADLKNEVQIKQESVKYRTTTNSKGITRTWYRITYQVESNTLSKNEKVLDSIEKVVYVFNPKWYTNPRRVSLDRFDNFKYSINVWGVTKVNFEIYINESNDKLIASSYILTGDNDKKITSDFNIVAKK